MASRQSWVSAPMGVSGQDQSGFSALVKSVWLLRMVVGVSSGDGRGSGMGAPKTRGPRARPASKNEVADDRRLEVTMMIQIER